MTMLNQRLQEWYSSSWFVHQLEEGLLDVEYKSWALVPVQFISTSANFGKPFCLRFQFPFTQNEWAEAQFSKVPFNANGRSMWFYPFSPIACIFAKWLMSREDQCFARLNKYFLMYYITFARKDNRLSLNKWISK